MGSATSFGQYIYAVSGSKEDSTGQYAVQRIHIDANDEFVDTVVINRHASRNWIPVVQASTDSVCWADPRSPVRNSFAFLSQLSFQGRTYLQIMLNSFSDSYIISGDGSVTLSTPLTSPSSDFVKYTPFAVINDVLHIFGGSSNKQKV